jgi:hypothetical protein
MYARCSQNVLCVTTKISTNHRWSDERKQKSFGTDENCDLDRTTFSCACEANFQSSIASPPQQQLDFIDFSSFCDNKLSDELEDL